MHLDDACQWLGWPSADSIRHPANAGAVVLVDLARAKIAEPLRRYSPRLSVETTVLAIDADSPQPLAIVCEFASGTTPEVLREAQRLAWNFSKTGLLITLEPHRLIAWSCLRSPDVSEDELRLCELKTDVAATPERGCQHSVRELLHWVSLITGEYVRKKPNFFRSDERADQLLLKNLRHIRRTLIQAGLPRDYCHDLLARVIFTQFLFHRKDSRGAAFFSETVLAQRCGGALRRVHSDLASILSDKSETYRLFEWLDTHFNGDLFPGKSDQSENEQASAWQAERDAVTPEHLQMLAELVSGTIDTQDRQLLLWPRYSFDTIPLEFISCVYEEFLNEDRDVNKAYYTPPFLVDYVLDAVLPWQGDRWNLRVLDPACGSGIFLVKAFQRIIHRWRQAHGGRPPLVRDLKPILANNFVGVDINPDAVRVACFSLYLAMVDAIEPRHYVSRDKVFPRLRGERLIAGDFFNEAIAVASAGNGTPAYDLVIGNAPWGEDSVLKTSDPAPAESAPTEKRRKNPGDLTHAQRWGGRQGWPIVNLDIGPLFIAKSLQLVTEEGQVAMLQPAPPWLYSRSEPAVQLRHKLFTAHCVDEITNLSAVRRQLFHDVIGPCCVLIVGRAACDPATELYYFTPKPSQFDSGNGVFCIEPQDVARLSHGEALSDSLIWSVLALGGRRDLRLVKTLKEYSSLAELKTRGQVATRMGVIPGNKKKELTELRDKPYFELTEFPENVFVELDASTVSPWTVPKVDSLHGIKNFEEFKLPQLLVKHSYSVNKKRFRAAIVRSSDPTWGVICKETYLSVRDLTPDAKHIGGACLVYNSLLATYFLALTSSRMGHYITEVLTGELMQVPLPSVPVDLSQLRTFDDIDALTRKLFRLTEADWVLVDDLLNVALPDALRKSGTPGRQSTRGAHARTPGEPVLEPYGTTFRRVLQTTFGRQRDIAFTILQEPEGNRLPVRVVTVHLDWVGRPPISVERMEADGLFDHIADFQRQLEATPGRGSMASGGGFQRVAYLFHSHDEPGGPVCDLTIIKPDQVRYWTRAQAMRDADELSSAILAAAAQGKVLE